MKTDSIFYQLFAEFPSIFFELIGRSTNETRGYQFRSVEIKQTAFRIDGVFLPPENSPDRKTRRKPLALDMGISRQGLLSPVKRLSGFSHSDII